MSSNQKFSISASDRYALALFELAQEESQLDKIEKEAEEFRKLINKNHDINFLVKNPLIGKKEQVTSIKKILQISDFSKLFQNFIELIANKRRLFFIEKILDSFENLKINKKGEIKANLISSKELSGKELDNFKKELATSLKSKMIFKYKYDPSLLGGLIVQIGSVMVDTSLKGKLRRLKEAMRS